MSQGFPAEMQQLVVAGVGGGGNFGPADGRGEMFIRYLDILLHKLFISYTVPIAHLFPWTYPCPFFIFHCLSNFCTEYSH